VKAKVLVIGGGVVGTSIALHAARRYDPIKEPVVLLERGDLAGGSSGSSGAILRQHYAEPVVASMARDSLRYYASFEGNTGRPLGFRRVGVLTLAGPSRPESMQRLERSIKEQRDFGIQTEVLDAAQIRAKMPGIEVDDRAIAAFESLGGYVDPRQCVREFAALARTYGAITRLGVEITDLVFKNGKIAGARTTDGDFTCEHAVVVAGASMKSFMARFGIDVPVRVARVQQLFVGLPASESDSEVVSEFEGYRVDLEDPMEQEHEKLMHSGEEARSPGSERPVLVDLEYGIYVRNERAERRVRVAPIAYRSTDIVESADPAAAPSDADTQWAREQLCKRLPVHRDQPVLGSAISWFPLSQDGRALIGPVPGHGGLWIAGGFGDHGFKLAPSVGEGVAQMLRGEPVSAFDPAHFAVDRKPARVDWSGETYL
jgi:glycine/D-amino acid oxidase-like deaminating enzyme